MSARPMPLERDVQQAIVDMLRWSGYEVDITDPAVRKGGQLHTVGLPDLFVWRRGFGNLYVALEVKRGPHARVSPAQRDRQDAGAVYIVWDAEQALQLVRARFREIVGGQESQPCRSTSTR